MLMYGPPEHVFVESEWYDGPRSGVANINGLPHRFVSQWDEQDDECLGSFLVWPVRAEELSLEQEQWRIFVEWNIKYEAGAASTESHPATPGTSKRWGEIEELLGAVRASAPECAQRARAQMVQLDQGQRYAVSGPDYQMSWCLL